MMKKAIFLISLLLRYYTASRALAKRIHLSLPSDRKHPPHHELQHTSWQGMDDVVDIPRISDVINDVSPDVVGLQEVDSVVNRSGNIDIIQQLSEHTGMHATYGYSILHDGGKYGNGLLTREEPLSVKRSVCPAPAKRGQHRLWN